MVIIPKQQRDPYPPTHIPGNPNPPSPPAPHRPRNAQMDPTNRNILPSRIRRLLRPNRCRRNLLFIRLSRVPPRDKSRRQDPRRRKTSHGNRPSGGMVLGNLQHRTSSKPIPLFSPTNQILNRSCMASPSQSEKQDTTSRARFPALSAQAQTTSKNQFPSRISDTRTARPRL